MTTALERYKDRWAVDDPVMDLIILWHDQRMYAAMRDQTECGICGKFGAPEQVVCSECSRVMKDVVA